MTRETGPMILLVEDEPAIRDMVAAALERSGFEAALAANAVEAEAAVAARTPDLVLLDWMLPGVSGLEIARRLRRVERTRQVPIIMLTARDDERDRLAGFEVGVDDYVCKPFSVRELVARIKAILKRAGHAAPAVGALAAGGLALDAVGHRVQAHGAPLKLGPTEFRLLRFFMENRERVFSRAQLLDHVWGRTTQVEERTVDVHIRRLRKALEPGGFDRLVQTVRGTGYRFSERAQ